MIRYRIRQGILSLALVIGGLQAGSSPAAAETMSFQDWLTGFKTEALSKGISQTTLDAAFKDTRPIPRVLELDKSQPEFTLTFQQYMDRVVPQSRIEKGRKKVAENKELIEKIAKKYNVPARFIAALWGIETDFGRTLGGFKVVDALATLAHDGRRSKFFRGELMNAVTIIDQGHVPADKMIGSWAGAMGQSQFMPSSFLNFAQDYDGDGKKDIWGTQGDVFASAANYLARSGWDGSATWGRAVKLPAGFDAKLADGKIKKRLSEWQALGVRKADGSDLPQRDLLAAVVTPEGIAGPAFVVYGNFDVILKWNRSTFFALAVGRLADGIGGM